MGTIPARYNSRSDRVRSRILMTLPAKYPTTIANTKHRTIVGGASKIVYPLTCLIPARPYLPLFASRKLKAPRA
jgi:hypothetical protein